MAKAKVGKRSNQENIPTPKGVKKESSNDKSAKGTPSPKVLKQGKSNGTPALKRQVQQEPPRAVKQENSKGTPASKLQGKQEKDTKTTVSKPQKKVPVKESKKDAVVTNATKLKAQSEQLENNSKKTTSAARTLSEADEDILAENERRFHDQRKRSLYVALPGKLDKVSDSALKALHPDILNVNRLAHSAFLIFSSETVRDKAFPILEKAHLKNHPLRVDYCCEKSKSKTQSTKIKQPFQHHGINLTQLVVSDLPKDTVNNVLEIVFPKSNDIKILKSKGLAYVNFQNEADALEAFKKGKVLKISSVPVVVRYRFVKPEKKDSNEVEDDESEVAPKKRKLVDAKGDAKGDSKKAKKETPAVESKDSKKAKKVKPVVESSEDEVNSDGEALDSEEEGFDGAFEEIGIGGSDLEGEDFAIQSDESSDDEE